jgi:hypothetical protein
MAGAAVRETVTLAGRAERAPAARTGPAPGDGRSRRDLWVPITGTHTGLRRLLVPYLPPASLLCHARSVAGRIPVQRLRGGSRATEPARRTTPGRIQAHRPEAPGIALASTPCDYQEPLLS